MGGGIHGLNVDFLLRTSFEMAGPDAVQAPDSEDLTSVPGKAWLHDDIAFRKEAAASGLADWSLMNLDLYNFYTRLVPQSEPPAASSPFPNSGSLSFNFCRSWNDGTYRWPFDQCWYHHSCEKCKGDHPHVNCPFVSPNGMSSTLEQLPTSVQTPAALTRSLDRSRPLTLGIIVYSSLVQFQFHAVPIRFRLMLLLLVNEVHTSFTTGHSITGAVQQDLVPPSRVTPLDADKLQRNFVFTLIKEGRILWYLVYLLVFVLALILRRSRWILRPRICYQRHFTLQWLISISSQNFRKVGLPASILYPASISPIPSLHVSRFGVIPKEYQPGKWWLILDLTSQLGHSVNDGIPKKPFSLQYMKVDDIISGIMSYDWGAPIAKFDGENTYCNVPVHSDDRYLLSMKWRGNSFIDLAHPLWLRSAPFIFSSIADSHMWSLSYTT